MRSFLTPLLWLVLYAGCSRAPESTESIADRCMTNLNVVLKQLVMSTFDGDQFPRSLNSLAVSGDSDPARFVCPSTGHAPGAMTNVAEWTDYIYVSSPNDSVMIDVALLICPPVNHGGRYGHVAWGGGPVVRLPSQQVEALIREPWCMPSVPGERHDRSYLSNSVKAQIPQKYRAIYHE